MKKETIDSDKLFIDGLYDDLCKVITAYETMEVDVSEKELYYMLVDIQNAWERITKG